MAETKDHKERRTHKFINSWAQLSMAAEIVLHAILLVALVALLLFAPPFATMFSQYSAADHQAIAKELVMLNVSKWPLFLALAAFVGVVSILFSHRIVGPAYKLQKTIHEMEEGNLGVEVKLRKSDYLGDLREALAKFSQRFRQDMKALSVEQEKLAALSKNNPEIQEVARSMGQIINQYKGLG